MASDGQRREKVECTAVGVCQRQERERASAALEIVRAGLGVYGSSLLVRLFTVSITPFE